MSAEDNLALCTRHWNWWIGKHLAGPDPDLPPGTAHLMKGAW